MEARIPARLTPAEGRRFGLTVGGAFLALSLLLWWRGFGTPRVVAAAIGAAFIVGGLLVPGQMGPVYRGWMRLGLAISTVTTPIIMGLIFFAVITPVGLIARAVGHRPLRRRGPSVWVRREAASRRSNLERQF